MFRCPSEKGLFWAIVSGFVVILIVAIAASGGFVIPNNGGGWFFHYQTLITASIAAGSVYFAWHTYKETKEKKALVARARLPCALNDLVDYCKRCFKYVLDDEESLPIKNEEPIKSINECIEFIDKETAKTLFNVVIEYQVHNANIESYRENLADPDMVIRKEDYLYRSLKLGCFVLQLFSYARDEVLSCSATKPSSREMFSTLRSFTNIWPHDIPALPRGHVIKKLKDKIDRRHS